MRQVGQFRLRIGSLAELASVANNGIGQARGKRGRGAGPPRPLPAGSRDACLLRARPVSASGPPQRRAKPKMGQVTLITEIDDLPMGDGAWKSEAMKRQTRAERYSEYINSPEWREKRRRYFASKRLPKTCLVCGSAEVQLHHRTYRRLGHEHLQDLVPLCQLCHSAGHDLIRRGGAKSIYRIAKRLARIKAATEPLADLPVDWKPPSSWGWSADQVAGLRAKAQKQRERWQDVVAAPLPGYRFEPPRGKG
jgi:hypothetical protein